MRTLIPAGNAFVPIKHFKRRSASLLIFSIGVVANFPDASKALYLARVTLALVHLCVGDKDANVAG